MKKQILFALLFIISMNCFGQDTLYYNKRFGVTVDTLWSVGKPQKDTVDVIALVSDTSSLRDYVGWQKETFIPISPCQTIKCKAVIDYWRINYEYLLPKKYIVWDSVIIDDKR